MNNEEKRSVRPDEDQKMGEAITAALVAHGDAVRITKVILFGSRARGAPDAGSDYDVLVVEKGLVSKREEIARLRKALEELPTAIDVWVMSEEEYEETKDVIGGLAYPASREGIVLYENSRAS